MNKPYSVAVVGMGGIFPSASNVSTYWANILSSLDASVEIPPSRWVDQPSWFRQRVREDRVASTRACLTDSIPEPKTARGEPLDELSRMSLVAAEMALEDATSKLEDRCRVATILASIALPTREASNLSEEIFLGQLAASFTPSPEVPAVESDPLFRQVTGRPAQVVAHYLGLGGPTLTLDAACASSLYAVKLACDALTEGRADAVLAGGANRADTLYTQEGFTALGACSRSGKCSPFDKDGDGLVVGEGAGFLLLKRVKDAVRDGDRVYAVIRGIGLSNDVGGSLLAPDSEGQLRALIQAYEQAGWSADDVGLVECHGTGTPMGDRMEFKSLTSFWPQGRGKKTTVLGSVKSQIGHLLTGAGVAGLVKVIKAIHHRTLPPMINFENPAKGIDLDNSPFEILSAPRSWEQEAPLRGGVSAFGFGGINGHVLLEEPRDLETEAEVSPTPQVEVVITAVSAKLGQAHDMDRLLLDSLKQLYATGERPKSRWPHAENLPAELAEIRGLFLDYLDVAAGDMKIPPKDLGDVLMQQSLLLSVAGVATRQSSLGDRQRCRRSGALIGLSLDPETTNYHLRWALNKMLNRLDIDPETLTLEQKEKLRTTLSRPLDSTRTLGALGSIVASRAAREFWLGGPSYAISCGELSGIRALEIGARAIANQEMDSCLVGAVDLYGDPRSVWSQDKLSPFTRDRMACPFSNDGDGPTLAEGAVVLVLKSRAAAELDGDKIVAVLGDIDATGGQDAYLRALESLKQRATESEMEIGFVDVLSQARPELDRQFLHAWHSLFSDRSRPAAVGTATSSVGFAGACAGLLSVARCAAALHSKVLPSLVNCEEPLETGSSLYLPRETGFWWHDHDHGPRTAVSSGVAAGGDAYSLTLYEAEAISPGLPLEVRTRALPAQLFLIPQNMLSKLAQRVKEASELSRLAVTWAHYVQTHASSGPRGALVARSLTELERGLEFLQRTEEAESQEILDGQAGVFYCAEPIVGETAWMFPGSGNHYLGMGRELATLFPEIASEVCAEAGLSYQHFTPWLTQPFSSDRTSGWEAEALRAIETDPLAPIFSQVTFAILASRILQKFLPRPQAALGYSLGESAALFSMGAWRDRDLMFHRTMKAPLFSEQLRGDCSVPRAVLGLGLEEDFPWTVAVVNRPKSQVEAQISALGLADLFLLIVNTPQECVVGGTESSVAQLAKVLRCDAFFLSGVPAVHCELMHPVEAQYRALHLLPTHTLSDVRFYNGHRAKSYALSSESAAESITENAMHGFSFPALVEQAYRDGVRRFLEIGPAGSCSRMVRTILADKPHWSRSLSLPKEGSEVVSLLKVLAGAYVQGLDVDLELLYGLAGEEQTAHARPTFRIQAGASLATPIFPPLNHPGPVSKPNLPVGASNGGVSTAGPEVSTSVSQGDTAVAIRGIKAVEQLKSPHPREPKTQPPSPRQAEPTRLAAPVSLPGAVKRALVWRPAAKFAPKSLTKDNQVMSSTPHFPTQDLQPVIGLHPQYHADPAAQVAASIVESTRQTALAHESYLELMEKTRQQMENLLQGAVSFQAEQTVPHPNPDYRSEQPLAAEVFAPPIKQAEQADSGGPWTKLDPSSPNPVMRGERPERHNVAYDRDMCMEFAIGSVAKVLGEKFRKVDDNEVRVRLPDDPLMLCDRILTIEGECGGLGSGRLVSEHDVFPQAWYLDHDRAPVCISVESGQADLFLCSYLGIDLVTDGTRAYRLLDATVSFHRGLPRPGETVTYDIRISRFVRQGEVYLFFFEYDGTVDGEPLITMRNGCAGFHTYEEITGSGGIILSGLEKQPAAGKAPAGWRPNAPFPHGLEVTESYSDAQVDAFRHGDLEGCFGSGFANLGLTRPSGLPTGRMTLLHRVLSLEPKGGRFGLGRIQGEADIHPDDWFLTCHFKDDMVMPGTLMYECCAHSLRFLLARLGWVAEEHLVAYEPKLLTPAQLKCRGPVTVETKKVLYQVDIKEIGFNPEPYVVTDALMFADGKAIVRFVDMSMKLTGLNEEYFQNLWGQGEAQGLTPQIPALYDKESIMEFSNGKPSLAFGPEYTVFDSERRIARLPGPPFQFVDRVVEVDHPKFVLQKGGWIEAHYDVPPDEWYFTANRQSSMAYCILLEAALQPCGWLAAYAGSALRSSSDVKFRNLGGTATLFKEVYSDAGTMRMRVRMTDVSEAGGMIIENFDMQVYLGDELVYDGNTYFGFFSAQALAKQVGVRDAAERTYSPTPAEWAAARPEVIPVVHPLAPEDDLVTPAPPANMPAKALLMMDQVDIFLPHNGGTKNLGFIQGSKIVDPEEWFFKAHFYQDPVWPGSLGLEAFLQLLRYAALQYWPELSETHRFEPIAVGLEHTWAYRGQVIPSNHKVVVDCSITRREEGESPLLVGTGFLRVDGTPIYEMMDFGLRLVPNS